MKKSALILISGFILSSCSVYRNKFACDPATGANCRSVEEIHAMLENGRIWELNGRNAKDAREDRGRSRSKNLPEADRIASNDGTIKVWIPQRYKQEEYRSGQYRYIPITDYSENRQ